MSSDETRVYARTPGGSAFGHCTSSGVRVAPE